MGRRIGEKPVYFSTFVTFALFVVLPIFFTLGQSFFSGKTLENFSKAFSSNTFLLLGKSALLASSIALLSTLLGTFLGFLLYKTTFRYRQFFKIALLLPLFLSPYVLAAAWKDFFYLFFHSSDLMMSHLGVILVLTTVFTPLAMLIVGSALTNITASIEESGLLIMNLPQVIFKIILPLTKSALFTSFVLIFIFSISEFSVAAFFGVKVFTTEIFTQFSAFYNHFVAISQAILLIIVCIFLLLSERKHLTNASFLSLGGKGGDSKIYSFKNLNSISWIVLGGWGLISILLPFGILIKQSFNNGTDKLTQAFLLLQSTFSNSLGLALAGAILTVIVGFIAAYHSEVKKQRHLDGLLLFVFAIPSTIFGISLIKFYNQPSLDFIYASYGIILIGYVGKFSFIASKIIGNAIKQIPQSMDEVGQVLGINKWVRLQKIMFPLLLPAFFTAFVINFIFCLGELGTTIMIYPPGTEIMPIKVFTIMANAPESLTSSMSLIVFTFTLLIILGFYLILKPFLKKHHYDL